MVPTSCIILQNLLDMKILRTSLNPAICVLTSSPNDLNTHWILGLTIVGCAGMVLKSDLETPQGAFRTHLDYTSIRISALGMVTWALFFYTPLMHLKCKKNVNHLCVCSV